MHYWVLKPFKIHVNTCGCTTILKELSAQINHRLDKNYPTLNK